MNPEVISVPARSYQSRPRNSRDRILQKHLLGDQSPVIDGNPDRAELHLDGAVFARYLRVISEGRIDDGDSLVINLKGDLRQAGSHWNRSIQERPRF